MTKASTQLPGRKNRSDERLLWRPSKYVNSLLRQGIQGGLFLLWKQSFIQIYLSNI